MGLTAWLYLPQRGNLNFVVSCDEAYDFTAGISRAVLTQAKVDHIMLFLFIFILTFVFGCGPSQSYESGKVPDQVALPSPTPTPTPTPTLWPAKFDSVLAPNKSEFTKTDAIVVFQWDEDAIKRTNGMIHIYDESGNIWKEVNYYDDSLDSVSEPGGQFRPYRFRVGDFDLEMRCTGKSEHWYEVIVQEEVRPKVKKYVNANDPLFKYQVWDEYVLAFYNVTFDQKENPILSSPNGARKKVGVLLNETWRIMPVEIRGEWLKIRWDEPLANASNKSYPSSRKQDKSGWIRWRKAEELLIDDFYP